MRTFNIMKTTMGVWDVGWTTATVHLLIVFYSKRFAWTDLHPVQIVTNAPGYYKNKKNVENVLKAMVCTILIAACQSGLISCLRSRILVIVLSLPQLFRRKGRGFQRLRVILGPLTPILACHNLFCAPQHTSNTCMAITSFLAFVVMRPDNTTVLEILIDGLRWSEIKRLHKVSLRSKIHGILAGCNFAVAGIACIVSCI